MLKTSPRLKIILETTNIIHSKRQPRNLKQLLNKCKFSDKTEGTVTRCGSKKCTTCLQLIVENTFIFKTANQEFKVKHNLECNSKSVLYVLTCAGCGENYIEETNVKLRERMTLYRQRIKDSRYRILPASSHVAQCAKHKEIKFRVFPF